MKIADLRLCQIEIPFLRFPVVSLSADPCENIHRRIAFRVHRKIVIRLRHHPAHTLQHSRHLLFPRHGLHLFQKAGLRSGNLPVISVKPRSGGDRESRVAERLLDGNRKPGIHLS